ncbi:MAG: hypothetical protein H8E29_16550 [Anaerolineales bacterium]|uniref:DnaA N-terminal domain-containing protein n=1 Tax=Candidatus Desulfolinea nitratireducens TaxID=2841698 RepID=A0A8J6TJT4_9CHLR|nr:hypothetical protein [Candidatus Desulfolinea nitratireducens]
MDIQQAWQTVLDQLQMEMPRASFDSWVRDTRAISYDDGLLTIGVRNAYARDWLESRLASTVSRLLIGIMNRRVAVEFVVAQTQSEEDEPDEPDGKEVSISTDDITSIYDQVVRPERAIYLPAYFRKHLAQLGPDLGWMYLGFRQAAYGEGARAGKKTARFSGKQIAALCGVTERTFWNRLERPQTWEKLAGLVTPIYGEAEWVDGPQPRRLPRKYTVAMTLPLTAADAHALMRWLQEQVEIHDGPLGTLAASVETPLQELLSDEPASRISGTPQDVLEILRQLFTGDLPDAQIVAFAERLRMHIMPQNDLIVVPHFFLEHILPYLGAGPAWMYILLRDRCYDGLGEQRDLCTVQGGYSEIASWLGIARPLTVYEWFYGRSNKKAKEPGKLRFPVTSAYLTVLDQGKATSFVEGARTFRVLLNDVPPEIVQAAIESDDDLYADFSIVFTQFADNHYATFSIVFTQFAEDLYAIFRVFKPLNSLKNPETLLKTSPLIPPQEKKKSRHKEKTGVGSMTYWDLNHLLAINVASPQKRDALRKAGARGESFAAWILYAYTPAGAGLRDSSGVSNAIARTLESPRGGPGWPANALAKLSPYKLKALLEKDLEGQVVDDENYLAAFGSLEDQAKEELLKRLFGD